MSTGWQRWREGFAVVGALMWISLCGPAAGQAQSMTLGEIKQKVVTHIQARRCDQAKRLVNQFRKQASNPTGPQVRDLESQLRGCYAAVEKVESLLTEIETSVNSKNFIAAEVKLDEFGAMPQWAQNIDRDRLSDARYAVETYWTGVRTTVLYRINAGDLVGAKAALEPVEQSVAGTGHPRESFVAELQQALAKAQAAQIQPNSNPSAKANQAAVAQNGAETVQAGNGSGDVAIVGDVSSISPAPSDTDVAGWVVAGLGTASVIVGGILLGLGYLDQDQLNSAETKNGVVVDTTRAEALELSASAEDKLNIGLGLAIGGGAALVTGIILLALPESDSKPITWVPGRSSGHFSVSF